VQRKMEQDRRSGLWVEVEMPQLAWQTCADWLAATAPVWVPARWTLFMSQRLSN